MKVDGQLKEYDSCWLYGFSQQPPSETFTMNILAGKEGDYSSAWVSDTKAIGIGTYRHTNLNTETNLPMANIGPYRVGGSADIYTSYEAGWATGYEATVTFTSFDSEVATGTFRGQMRQVDGDIVLTVTEGEFRAYIKK